ncbi:hypothetical protein GON26_12900 [Flavobacterium sp. GA093]|uniref:Anti-sigma factor n=1 Tax=Flavobacterium hydrocarbonoxydans TaxID=2683249 RepID=A0A6I4NM64_9FLAO|nr:hypothetical protein [Flavobacterium hydrocarbonoxydans]MWB95261.1 hypothetical protein [Flavobacterium hydrocarbonoxydans]
MEPNNFEKDFRKKINQRTIEPSDKAWDRLDAMLNIVENKKPKKRKTWLYVAASIMGFLVIGTVFFIQNKNNSTIPQNNVTVEENIQKDSVVKPDNNVLNPVKSAENEVAVVEETTIKNNKKSEKKLNQVSVPTLKNQVAESSVIIKNNPSNQSITSNVNIQNPQNETVEKVFDTTEKNVLAENSAKPKTKSKSKVKVNASDLLNQVDGELELSFREKVIATVNKNYQTVKVAVANRNQEDKQEKQ